MIYTLLIIVAVLIGWQGYEFWVAVGRNPRGERLERCKQSPQWKDGEFVNVHETPALTGDDGFFEQMWKFLFGRVDNLKPGRDIPVVKTSLKDISRTEEVCVWLGHSSVFIQTGGVRFLFDPVLTQVARVVVHASVQGGRCLYHGRYSRYRLPCHHPRPLGSSGLEDSDGTQRPCRAGGLLSRHW